MHRKVIPMKSNKLIFHNCIKSSITSVSWINMDKEKQEHKISYHPHEMHKHETLQQTQKKPDLLKQIKI